MMKRMIISMFAFLMIIGVIGVSLVVIFKPFGISNNESSDVSLVKDRVVELSEWTTLKYEYSNVIISQTDKSLALPGISDIKFAEAIKLIEYSGYLKAGSDLSKLEVSHDQEKEQLSIRVPKAQILDNVAQTETAVVKDIKGELFSDYPTQKVFDDINTNKKQLAEEKIDQGFLDEADKRTKELLTSLISSMGYNDIEIEFY